jgi:hypothetical protein
MTAMGEITLEFIGEQLLRLTDGQRRIERTLDDMLSHLQSLESNAVDIKRDIVRIDHRLDGFEQRLTRIEPRLDPVDS